MKFKLPRRFILALLIVLMVAAVPVAYARYRLDLRPVSTQGAAKEFTVAAGENAPAVARRLAESGLIRDRTAFVTYINLHGLRSRIRAGVYSIRPTLSGQQIAAVLTEGRTVTKRFVVPEGYRLSQIEAAATALGLDQGALQSALNAPHQQSFLSGKPANVDLEGYLFPDSYEVTTTTKPADLVNSMLDNFGKRVGSEYVQAFAAEGLTLHQGLTLASVVEREVSIPADRPVVAQIFLKRLKTGMPLGADATSLYASQLLGVPFDVNVNSPYNTRRFANLPPGPICSPGLGSLDAIAHPASTDYIYFLSGKDGKTYFAKTYAEHQQNIAKHL